MAMGVQGANDPYVHVLGPSTVQVVVSNPQSEVIQYSEEIGDHCIWAAKVPFIPALDSEELSQGGSRIGKIVGRHFRFLYDLAHTQEHHATYELRFIAHPPAQLQQTGRVEIAFLTKVFDAKKSQARLAAIKLWHKFVSNFPLEDPFNYPLQPVVSAQEFEQLYEPVPFGSITPGFPLSIVEIRRYEEVPVDLPGTPPALEKEYIVHPFVPTLDYSAMGRLFETLAVQSKPCFASISIRPIRLSERETYAFNGLAGRLREMDSDKLKALGEYRRARAEMGAKIYTSLMKQREFLMQIKVQVVGLPQAPQDLVEALGSEMMNNGRNEFPAKWICAVPQNDDEFAIAKRNLMLMEHIDWGPTIAPAALQRLRTIVDVYQASGAFRLPIPPESGYMPGILVKREPFVAPQDHLDGDKSNSVEDQMIQIGSILHRGSPTGRHLSIPTQSLTRHALIAGSTGSGKTTTIATILVQLWQQQPKIPFLVLYPLDKPDYRQLMHDGSLGNDLLIFTVGDDTVAPFRFNPFAVPVGVLLKTHLSRLMRAFGAAFDLFPPLPMIYREALRLTYRRYGWNIITDVGGSGHTSPTLQDFYESIVHVTDSLQYAGEVKDNVRQASVIRISDLLENAGHVLNVRESSSFAEVLKHPVVMELGRIGSQEDINLVMGFLLMLLVETLEKRNLDIPHITVVEEAHRLMARSLGNGDATGAKTSSASEDFANILAEIRGFNAGLLIAEQLPSQLVHSAMGNTYLKVMHWLEDSESFNLFADLMNLNEQQRAYTRRLQPGEAIVRSRFGRPVHIQVASVGLEGSSMIGRQGTAEYTFGSDVWLAANMPGRLSRAGIAIPPTQPVTPAATLNSADIPAVAAAGVRDEIALRIYTAPLAHFCAFCHPWLERRRCPYRSAVSTLRQPGHVPELGEQVLAMLTGKQWAEIAAQIPIMLATLTGLPAAKAEEAAYCYVAHAVRDIYSSTNASREDLTLIQHRVVEFVAARNRSQQRVDSL